MDFLIFLVLAAGVTLVVVKVARNVRGRIQQRRVRLKQLADQHGWVLDDDAPDSLQYHLHGSTDGIDWRVVAGADTAGSDASTSTKWSSECVTYPDLVGMIRTRKGYDLLQGAFGRAASGVLQAMIGVTGLPQPQHNELVRTGTHLQPSGSDVGENFVVIVRPGSGLDALLTPELEAALAAWSQLVTPAQKDTLSVDVGQTNLRVYCQYTVDPEHIEAFVNVGLAVARALPR